MCYDVNKYLAKMEKLEERYGEISVDREALQPSHLLSAFSKGTVPVLTPGAPYKAAMVKWGFVPSWAKNAADGAKLMTRTFNCRADTLLEKINCGQQSMFKAYVNNPCVILIEGFFEWHTTSDGTKVPYYVQMQDGQSFAVAGLTCTWKDFADQELTYTGTTLCTTAANELLSWVHNQPANSEDLRMPGILLPEEISTWLDTSLSAKERLAMIRSYPSKELKAHSVINYRKKENKDKLGTEAVLEPYDYHLEEAPIEVNI